MLAELKRYLIGDPLPTHAGEHERLTKVMALAVFSSDALSSVAYATEEIMRALVDGMGQIAGSPEGVAVIVAISMSHVAAISACIVALLTLVAMSYQQTIHAYPQGGGAYTVAKENLGQTEGLVAASSLLVDYVLTVAVSVAAGVAAITSALPWLYPARVALAIMIVIVLTLGNLRGLREGARLFSLPPYLFIASLASLVVAGLCTEILHGAGATLPHVAAAAAATAGAALPAVPFWLILRAFSSGCTALTGMEAISNGVSAFQPPESRNASITMGWMSAILAMLFLGVSHLAAVFPVQLRPNETLISLLAETISGRGLLYYAVQVTTAMALVLAANTAFNDFPRLSSIMARDGFVPRQLAHRGDRLVFSNGIVLLALLAMGLLVAFRAETHALIPLYAIGVFVSFTLSQLGMVLYWRKHPEPGSRRSAALNLLGGLLSGVVLCVTLATKFMQGAWMVVLFIPMLVMAFRAVRAHYDQVSEQLALPSPEALPDAVPHLAIVPVALANRGALTALRYARSVAREVVAVSVEIDPALTEHLRNSWKAWGGDTPLVTLPSPYRSFVGPMLEFLQRIKRERPAELITVVLPEFVPVRWWHIVLHNQSSLMLRAALLFEPGIVVTTVRVHGR